MSIKDRGFGSMSEERRKQIASMGGKSAKRRHSWNPETGREAGRKGGLKRAENAKKLKLKNEGVEDLYRSPDEEMPE